MAIYYDFIFFFSSARIPLYERQTNKTQQTRQILHYTVPWLTARFQLLGPSNERFSCISFLRKTYLSPVKRSGLFSKYTYVPIGCSSLLRISSRIADRMGQLSRINDVYDTYCRRIQRFRSVRWKKILKISVCLGLEFAVR